MQMRLLAVAVVLMAAACVVAQEEPVSKPAATNSANLTPGFPTSIADNVVSPVNGFEFGLAGGYVTDGARYETALLSLTYGILDNLQLSGRWPVILGEGKVDGNGDTTLSLVWAPTDILGLELAGRFPTGDGFTGYDGTINGILTYPIDSVNLLANAAYTTVGNNTGDIEREHTDSFKVGADYMALDNLCVIVDVFSDMALVRGADRVEMIEVGGRYDLTDVDILSMGMAVGIGNGNATPEFVGTVGYQREM